METAKLRLLGFAQIKVGEQPPGSDGKIAHKRLFDSAETTDELGR
jgi:hypothetical protein